MTVIYEYVVETLDFYPGCGDNPDIIDTNEWGTLEEAKKWAAQCTEPTRIALRRDEGNDTEGLTDRGYAYYDEAGNLPERFETAQGLQDGALVPRKYRNQL